MKVDLTTRYLGLELRNPLVASSSPLTGVVDAMRELEDAGIAAVVLPSLFEEQIEHDEMEMARLAEFGAEGFAEALDYFPELETYNTGPDVYLEHIASAKDALSIPVIASLNGVTVGGWARYAKLCEQAGADALELNVYDVPMDVDISGAEVEQRIIDVVRTVGEGLSIPLTVKLSPFFSSLPNMAKRLAEAGAKGLSLFNRFMQPDIDLDKLEVRPSVELSTSSELRLPTRWIAILRGRVDLSLAATTGVHMAEDALKLLFAGADVTMMASALLRHGASYPRRVLEELRSWLIEREYESVEQLKGSMSLQRAPDPSQFGRGQYMRTLVSYSTLEL
ncbi:MAG: dihydroorotate dehydrogenase-like protein [Myxococcales bacterium]|nr:dihydroorotate dehydrogenase-like protein [Myxococcales bacterium]